MKTLQRFPKMLATSAMALSTLASSVTPLMACDRRGGGGFRGGYSSYAPPVYSQPRYPQPVYSQPSYSQPTYSQGFNPAPAQGPRPTSFAATPAPQRRPAPQPPQRTRLSKQQQAPQQQAPQQQAPQQQLAQQPAQQQAPQQQAPQQQAPQQQQLAQQPAQQQQSSARQSALQMLLGTTASPQTSSNTAQDTAMPQFQPTPSSQAAHIGSWKATLPNNASITLELQDDGSFTWSARNQQGQVSQFQGSFLVNDGALTLIREDKQQLSGSLTLSNRDAFTFKLNDAKDNGLNFQRS